MTSFRSTVEVISASSPEAPGHAAKVLIQGGIVAVPTDTVYGLAAAVDDAAAIARLYATKHRPESKAIPVLLADAENVRLLAQELPPAAMQLAEAYWPGPLTLVVAARSDLAAGLTTINDQGVATVAMRVPNHEILRQILRRCGGAAAVTSANLSGNEPATNASMLLGSSLTGLDLIIDGGEATLGMPSTIVEIRDSRAILLREGAISGSAIRDFLASVPGIAGPDAPNAV